MCAEFNGEFVTFNNSCEIIRTNCRNKTSFVMTHEGACEGSSSETQEVDRGESTSEHAAITSGIREDQTESV